MRGTVGNRVEALTLKPDGCNSEVHRQQTWDLCNNNRNPPPPFFFPLKPITYKSLFSFICSWEDEIALL